MLQTILSALRSPELRKKLLFTAAILAIYRFGSFVPVPGIDLETLQAAIDERGSRLLDFLNLFAGGALTRFAVFALGIMPYITASIIMQVLGVVIPKLEEWQQQGAIGQRKITQWTRYVTMGIAVLQSTAMAFLFHNGGGGLLGGGGNPTDINVLDPFTPPRVLLVVLVLTSGTALLMWMGELITQRGIGNGMSLLIFSSIVSAIPGQFGQIYVERGWGVLLPLILLFIGVLVAIVFVENGQRRIPVQFAKRVVGRRMYGGQSTYIPLKVNQSGVIPIIFASSILLLPAILVSFLGGAGSGWRYEIQRAVDNYILNSQNIVYVSLFALLIIAFAYFYNSIAFDPVRQADQIRRQGGFIPGVRPGPQTEAYLAKAVNRITLPGAVFIALIAILPYLILWAADVSTFAFAGTSILISVGVALELMRQIDAQLMLRNYEGFLK